MFNLKQGFLNRTEFKNSVSVFEESCDEKIVFAIVGEKSSYFIWSLKPNKLCTLNLGGHSLPNQKSFCLNPGTNCGRCNKDYVKAIYQFSDFLKLSCNMFHHAYFSQPCFETFLGWASWRRRTNIRHATGIHWKNLSWHQFFSVNCALATIGPSSSSSSFPVSTFTTHICKIEPKRNSRDQEIWFCVKQHYMSCKWVVTPESVGQCQSKVLCEGRTLGLREPIMMSGLVVPATTTKGN